MTIWNAKLDDRYDVKVMRSDDDNGRLQIYEGEELLLDKRVPLAYGAIFGPDTADVAVWMEMAVDFVDERLGS